MWMSKTSVRFMALLLGVLIGFQIFVDNEESVSTPEQEWVQEPVEVIVITASMDRLVPHLTLPATLEAGSVVDIVAQVGGEITEVYVKEGDWVTTDQVLIAIEQDDSGSALVSQYEQAVIGLQSSESSLSNLSSILSEEIAQMQVTIRDIEDALENAEDQQGLTETGVEAQIEVYEAQVASALTSWELAQLALENTEIQLEQAIDNAQEQARSTAATALDSAETALKAIDEFLGVDKENFDPTYLDVIDTISNHIYVARAEEAYKTARDTRDAAESYLEVSTSSTETTLERSEEALEATIDAVEALVALLNRDVPLASYVDDFEALRAEYSPYESTLLSYLLSLQSARQAVETAELTLETSLDELEANIGAAEQNYNAAVATLENAEAQGDQQVSGADYSITSLENQLASAEQSLAVLQAQYDQQLSQAAYDVELRQNQVEQAQIQVESGLVLSPLDGVFAASTLKVGQVISPGVTLATVVNTKSFVVEFFVSEFELPYLKVGHTVPMELDAYSDEQWTAQITYISPIPDSFTRTYRVEASFQYNADVTLASGMSGEVTLELDDAVESQVVIPLEAVVSSRGLNRVFVVREGIAHEREVTLGFVSDTSVEILSGLEEGDTVVVQGHNLLDEGDPVSVLETR